MAKEGLDIADVGAVFQKVGGEGVAKTVYRGFYGDCCAAEGFVKNVLGSANRKGAAGGLAREEPGLDIVKGIILGDE